MVDVFIENDIYEKIEKLMKRINKERIERDLSPLNISEFLGIMVNYFKNELLV